jgi:D-alanyl-D-alanine carboxypeptidase
MTQNKSTGRLSRIFARAALAVGLALASAPAGQASYQGSPALPAQGTTDIAPLFINAAWDPPKSSIVIDFKTGTILSQSKADELRHPASLTKVMTLMMAFDALRDGRLKAGQDLTVSAHAASRSPVKLGLKAGSTIKIEDAMKLVATKSTNDMAAVIAEAIGGTEADFAVMMTEKARTIGMDKTVFKNASGLPDAAQVTTAMDMAVMTRHLIREYETEYETYMGKRSVAYNGRAYGATNRMLGWYKGMDGVKTGFINASGFNLISSAERDGRRLIGVVFGGTSSSGRDREMGRLLDAGFKAAPKMIVPIPTPRPRPDNLVPPIP